MTSRLLDRMEDIQGMLARYKAEGASSETLEEVSEYIRYPSCLVVSEVSFWLP